MAGKSRVVVIGGGVGGALIAKTLQQHADVYLIDPKEYFEIPWTWPRSVVEPKFAEKTVINHKDYLKNGTHILSSAVDILENEVKTADGRVVAFDFLVIATGHAYPVPSARTDRLTEFQTVNEKVTSAKSILIVGGGPTGVELAGEIAVDFPDKKVTIVHRGSRLMEFIGAKASKKALNWLVKRKVDVLLGQSVNVDARTVEGTYVTSNGETIAADCHFVCAGARLGSSWLQDTCMKVCLDSNGRVMVDEHLRVKGHKNIFAIGDITDVPEIKQGFYAEAHALLVAKNIKIVMNGGSESIFGSYKAGSALAMVSLGRKDAVAQLPMGTFIGCLPGMIKSRGLFVGKTRKQLGV